MKEISIYRCKFENKRAEIFDVKSKIKILEDVS